MLKSAQFLKYSAHLPNISGNIFNSCIINRVVWNPWLLLLVNVIHSCACSIKGQQSQRFGVMYLTEFIQTNHLRLQ